MAVYVVAQIDIKDRERYGQYEAGFAEIFSRHNGKLLSVDESPRVLEGEWPGTRTVLIEFSNAQDLDAWYHSAAYQELAQHRFAASIANIVVVNSLAL